MQVLNENWGEFLFNCGAEKNLLTRTQNLEAIKIRIDEFGTLKKYISSITKDLIKFKDS